MQDSTEVGEGARRGEGHKGVGAPRGRQHPTLTRMSTNPPPPTAPNQNPTTGCWRALGSFLGRPPPDPTFRKDCFPCRPGEGEVAAHWGLWWGRGGRGLGEARGGWCRGGVGQEASTGSTG